MPHDRFQQLLREENQKRLNERDDESEKRRRNQREFHRCGALLSLRKGRSDCCVFFPDVASCAVMRLSYCKRLAVLDATLMKRFVSALEMSPPV